MKKKDERCKCIYCKRNKKWYSLMKKYDFTKKDREFLEHIYATLDCVELDNEVNDAVMAGEWPGSEKRLERALLLTRINQKKKEEGYEKNI